MKEGVIRGENDHDTLCMKSLKNKNIKGFSVALQYPQEVVVEGSPVESMVQYPYRTWAQIISNSFIVPEAM